MFQLIYKSGDQVGRYASLFLVGASSKRDVALTLTQRLRYASSLILVIAIAVSFLAIV